MDKESAEAIISLYDRLRAVEPIIRYAKAQQALNGYIAKMTPTYEQARRVITPTVTVLRVGERIEVFSSSEDARAAERDYLESGVKPRQLQVVTCNIA